MHPDTPETASASPATPYDPSSITRPVPDLLTYYLLVSILDD